MPPTTLPGKAAGGVNKSNTTRPASLLLRITPSMCLQGAGRGHEKAFTAILSAHLLGQAWVSPTQASSPAAGVAGEAPGNFPSDNRRSSLRPPAVLRAVCQKHKNMASQGKRRAAPPDAEDRNGRSCRQGEGEVIIDTEEGEWKRELSQ